MPVPDLSNLRALIADDRAEVRETIAAKLRELGVTRIEMVPTAIAGTNLISLITDGSMAQGPEPQTEGQVAELVARFTHDIASPLTSAVLLSRFLSMQAPSADGTGNDARSIHAAVEEIADKVRGLTQRLAAAAAARRTSSS